MRKLFVVVAGIVLAACGAEAGGGATVAGAWARTTAPGQTLGAVYFDLTVDADDRLVGASVPPDVATRAEIHEVVAADVSAESSGTETSDGTDEMSDMETSEGTHDMSDMETSEGTRDMSDMETSEGTHDMSDMETSEGTHDMSDMEVSGDTAMTMRQMADGLALTGGETVSFEPGSYHVMLPELTGPLEAGDEFDLTLAFENADDVTVTVEVAETAP